MNMLSQRSFGALQRRTAALCLAALAASIGAIASDTPYVRVGDDTALPPAAEMPWVPAHSIWFLSNRTEIDQLEAAKFVALAGWVRDHAGSEVGISRPKDAVDPESAQARTDQLRVSAIRDAMIAAGIPEDRIHVGVYGGPLSAVDRRVLVFVRKECAAEALEHVE